MTVTLHPHATARLSERGASEAEVKTTVTTGERFPAKFVAPAFGGILPGMESGGENPMPPSRSLHLP